MKTPDELIDEVTMSNLRIKTITGRYALDRTHSPWVRRLVRIMWERGEPGDGTGYSVKLSFAISPRAFLWVREGRADWFLVILGLRIHYARSYSGRFG